LFPLERGARNSASKEQAGTMLLKILFSIVGAWMFNADHSTDMNNVVKTMVIMHDNNGVRYCQHKQTLLTTRNMLITNLFRVVPTWLNNVLWFSCGVPLLVVFHSRIYSKNIFLRFEIAF
jgi:hypothetical protein